MNFKELEQNLVDVIQEIQIKLGYAENSVGLYYPLESLNRMLHAEGVAYVRSRFGENTFLKALIEQTEKHDCSIQDIREVFARFSDSVACREINDGEFDYLFYFEDGVPDDYRYCVKSEGRHVIYHRFTPGDYEAMYVYKSPKER